MAPYNPPNAHYAHVRVDMYGASDMESFMGARGRRFYNLTDRLGMYYIWWNKKFNIIEIWGPYESFRDNDPVGTIHEELEEYFDKNMSQTSIC